MCHCTAGDVLPSQKKVYYVRAVVERSYRACTLRYRSEGFGAVARAHHSLESGMECDFGSTRCRVNALVSM